MILDVDSTLCGIEGVDWLATRRGGDLAARIAGLTDQAMRGEIALDAVYGERLALIGPTRDDLAALSAAYAQAQAPGAAVAVRRMRAVGVRLALVSGGLREAILPVARELGFADGDVHAVRLTFDAAGTYVDFDRASPLTTQEGKSAVARSLDLPRPVLAVGDGATDAAMRPAVDAFAAFTGFVRREPVVRAADFVIPSFDSLLDILEVATP